MATCVNLIKGCALRIAQLEPNGVPAPEADALAIVTFVSLGFTPLYEEGEEIRQRDACGDIAVAFEEEDALVGMDVTLSIAQLDPELHALIHGGEVITDGAATGYAFPEVGEALQPDGVSIEAWARRFDSDGNQDDEFVYERFVFPKTRKWKFQERTINNGHMMHTWQGRAYENANWFDGPGNDWNPDSNRILQHLPTNTIPATTCGTASLAGS